MWRLWIGLGLVGIAAGLTLMFVSCQSPRKPHLTGRRTSAGKEPAAQQSGASPSTGKGLEPPRASVKDDSQQIFDPDHPCLTRGQARRAYAVLFHNRTRPDPETWIPALNDVMYELKAECTSDDFLLLAVTTIQMESNVHIDPPVGNANLEELYANRLKGFRREHPLEAAALNVSGLDEQLRTKLRQDTRKGKVHTEADLDRYVLIDLRPWLLKTLQSDYHLPSSLASLVVGRAVPDPVHTIGPMQVDVDKAFRNARKRGESVASAHDMKMWLLDPATALRRGLLEGVYLLDLSYRYYLPLMDRDKAVLFSGADYNAGEFSSRNAAFQEEVAILTGRKLVLDGDLLLYNNGEPEAVNSRTEGGVLDLLQGQMTADQVRRDLLQEKESSFSETRTAKSLCALFETRRKMTCVAARLPVGAANPTAENKWGMTLTPANYAYGYQKRFKTNRAMYDEASADDSSAAPVVGAPSSTPAGG
jgi:Protein of unknown function (DUF1615)